MKLTIYTGPPVESTVTEPDAVMIGVYGTVMCGFGPALACYPWNDPDLRGKVSVDVTP
jgi:hypothetical protein